MSEEGAHERDHVSGRTRGLVPRRVDPHGRSRAGHRYQLPGAGRRPQSGPRGDPSEGNGSACPSAHRRLLHRPPSPARHEGPRSYPARLCLRGGPGPSRGGWAHAPRDEGAPVTVPFDPTRRTIIVRAEITGPTGTGTVDLTLDTGSTDTFVDDARLAAVGYTPAHVTNQFQVVTGSGIVSVFEVPVMTI